MQRTDRHAEGAPRELLKASDDVTFTVVRRTPPLCA
jgi:hypothetical protein